MDGFVNVIFKVRERERDNDPNANLKSESFRNEEYKRKFFRKCANWEISKQFLNKHFTTNKNCLLLLRTFIIIFFYHNYYKTFVKN